MIIFAAPSCVHSLFLRAETAEKIHIDARRLDLLVTNFHLWKQTMVKTTTRCLHPYRCGPCTL